ncbi:MAG: hypothetical protein WBW80_23110 [Acidimicrobiales bacterium]
MTEPTETGATDLAILGEIQAGLESLEAKCAAGDLMLSKLSAEERNELYEQLGEEWLKTNINAHEVLDFLNGIDPKEQI